MTSWRLGENRSKRPEGDKEQVGISLEASPRSLLRPTGTFSTTIFFYYGGNARAAEKSARQG
jgi:hypothetical protein